MDVAGQPLLARVLERVRQATCGPPIVATSNEPADDVIAELARCKEVAVFRGALDDVAARAHEAALAFALDTVVRISGDSPFVDPRLIDQVASLGATTAADIATNVFPRSFPPGASVEAITAAALGRIVAETQDPADREHVTAYAYRHPERYRIVNYSAGHGRYAGVALAVDTVEDLERARWMAERLPLDADLDAVVAAAREAAVALEART